MTKKCGEVKKRSLKVVSSRDKGRRAKVRNMEKVKENNEKTEGHGRSCSYRKTQ